MRQGGPSLGGQDALTKKSPEKGASYENIWGTAEQGVQASRWALWLCRRQKKGQKKGDRQQRASNQKKKRERSSTGTKCKGHGEFREKKNRTEVVQMEKKCFGAKNA